MTPAIDPDELWAEVGRRAPDERFVELAPLRRFLSGHTSPHAQALSGRSIEAPLDQPSAESLESAVIARIRDVRAFTKYAGAEWLRLLYDAQKRYDELADGVEVFTRLALVLQPEPSPFSAPFRAKARPVMHWRDGFDRWLADLGSRAPTPSEWQAGMALSSVLYGQLIDKGKLMRFVDALDVAFSAASGRPYAEFHQQYAGLGDFHCQRWFLDPVTEMLSFRKPGPLPPASKTALMRSIRELLKTYGVPKALLPKSLAALIESATAEWYGHSARVDTEVIRRGVIAHGFHERTWSRLFDPAERLIRKSASADETLGLESDDAWRADVELLFPWWANLRRSIEFGDCEVASAIAALRGGPTGTAEVITYLDWIDDLLAGRSATRKGLSPSTAYEYASAAIPILLSLLGTEDPAEFDQEALAEYYGEAMAVRPPDVPGRVLAKALREFHAFLCRRRNLDPLASVREVLGDDAGLEPVDANVLTVDEYFAARRHLDQLVLQGRDPDQVLVAKIAMTLAFRGGMRRMEIFGLRLNDVSSPKHLEFLITEHIGRQLKTAASNRVVPIRFLMTQGERTELRAWVRRRLKEEEASPYSHYLFALPAQGLDQVSAETVSDRIIEAISHATGHPKTRIHQLRHAFGTWLYLALRAPDYPGIETFLDDSPRTRHFLRQGRRLRAVLGIGSEVTSRNYAFAVARLLGHSSPLVSLGHYIHSSEFLQYQLGCHRAGLIPRESLLGLTQLKPLWGGRLFRCGLMFVLEHVRRRHRNRVAPAKAQSHVKPSSPKPRRGRPPIREPAEWIPLRKIHGFLSQCATTKRDPKEIADLIGIPGARAAELIAAAKAYASRFKIPVINESGLPALPFPRKLAEHAWEARCEERIKRAFARAPTDALHGVTAHLDHFTPPKGDVVFRGEKERTALDTYTWWLQLAGFMDDDIEVVIRSKSDESPVPSWARRRLKILGRYGVRRVRPPVDNASQSYEPWVGIMLRDGQSARPLLTRGLMLLAAIAMTNAN